MIITRDNNELGTVSVWPAETDIHLCPDGLWDDSTEPILDIGTELLVLEPDQFKALYPGLPLPRKGRKYEVKKLYSWEVNC